MLVLSRKANEKILIGENVVVTVVSIRGGKVRLGVEAPDDVPVHRAEARRAVGLGARRVGTRKLIEVMKAR